MKGHTLFVFALIIVSGVYAAGPVQIRDDRGVTVVFAQPPQRIVSLLPSLSEVVCALGQCQRLVGTDRYSNFPESLRSVAKVGGGLDPSVEAVLALRPDVVLLATSSPAAARLSALGLKVVAIEPKNHADVRRALELLGQLLEVPDALRIWHDIDSGVTAAAQTLPASLKGVRVYFEVNSAPYAAGESSFIGQTLTRLGVRNIVPAELGQFPRVNPEFVVRANPGVIMVSDARFEGLAQRPGWSGMPAIQAQRVCAFTPDQTDMMVRPGPRMAEAAHLMAQCLLQKAP